MTRQPEVWLRGPLQDIPVLLQPVAHAILQSQEEIHQYTQSLPEHLLWERPAGTASPGFHLQHIRGVLDRLFSYARKKPLSEAQLNYLQKEGQPDERISLKELILAVDQQILDSIDYLKKLDPATLTEFRAVGRQKLPSTHLGLLVHAAEHTQRHVGQLYVTIQVVCWLDNRSNNT